MLSSLAAAALLLAASPSADDVEEAIDAAQRAIDAEDSLYKSIGYRWHTADPGRSVQFGVPETDDRALRLDCDSGRIAVFAPVATDAAAGSAIPVVFQGTEERRGRIIHLGDGANVEITLAADDPLLLRLFDDTRLHISAGDSHHAVPLRGSIVALGPLLRDCR